MAKDFTRMLLGKDLRTIRQNNAVIRAVHDQPDFNALFALIFHHERSLVMRAVDAVEKITRKHPEYLQPHKVQLLDTLKSADHKELKWHIAQLVPRVPLTREEVEEVKHALMYWALNRNESKIVRVNALQGLSDLSGLHPEIQYDFNSTIEKMEHEMIPSIQARIRKLRNRHLQK